MAGNEFSIKHITKRTTKSHLSGPRSLPNGACCHPNVYPVGMQAPVLPSQPGAACEAAFNECFMGSIEARTCAKRRPVDGWVLIYCSVHHPGDNFFKRKLI